MAPGPSGQRASGRPKGHDGCPAFDLLAGYEVAERGVKALHGNPGLVRQPWSGHLEPAEVPLRLERQAAVIVGQVDRAEEALALVERALVEVEEDGRGVVGRLVVLGGLD